MYHEATFYTKAYYDTIEEVPETAKVKFPDGREVEMTADEMLELDRKEGWWTIEHECNYGVCDHWTSWSLTKWVNQRFSRITQYVNKQGEVTGYNRVRRFVALTKNSSYWKSEVWNS